MSCHRVQFHYENVIKKKIGELNKQIVKKIDTSFASLHYRSLEWGMLSRRAIKNTSDITWQLTTYVTNITRLARVFHWQHALLFVIGFKDMISLFYTTLPRPFRCAAEWAQAAPLRCWPSPSTHSPLLCFQRCSLENDFPNALSCTEPRRSFDSFTRAIAINYKVICVL